ncbi:MAG: hypothetical protein R3F43_06165 [bacterium]
MTGAAISGSKIGGPVDDCFVLFPDPMGATGGSLSTAIANYLELGQARRLVTLNLIVTPEFIRTLQARCPGVVIYALRARPRACRRRTSWTRCPGPTGTASRAWTPGSTSCRGRRRELMNNSWV